MSQIPPTRETIQTALEHTSREERCRFLLLLAHELTTAARETYVVGADDVHDPRNLRRYNELMHRVVANARELMDRRCEDVWCWPMIVEINRALPEAIYACQKAYTYTFAAEP